ncbi:MAG: hypothetical protein K2X81_26855 [Candidatus Obscuribacterales bacterium]|nr:hypothetical protein [Candidatus Obscuribacterales bacterium]
MKKIVILAVAVLTVGLGAFSAKALAGKANEASCCVENAACCPASDCCK